MMKRARVRLTISSRTLAFGSPKQIGDVIGREHTRTAHDRKRPVSIMLEHQERSVQAPWYDKRRLTALYGPIGASACAMITPKPQNGRGVH